MSKSLAARQRVLLDTGLLVAMHVRDDRWHAAVREWLGEFQGTLHTVEPVLTEAAHFLPVRNRRQIAAMAERGLFTVHPIDTAGHARIGQLFDKYADQDPDWADMALVWLAESAGIHRIATLDIADFSVYRINGRKRFELALLG